MEYRHTCAAVRMFVVRDLSDADKERMTLFLDGLPYNVHQKGQHAHECEKCGHIFRHNLAEEVYHDHKCTKCGAGPWFTKMGSTKTLIGPEVLPKS